jgi:ankyrin repeat protein
MDTLPLEVFLMVWDELELSAKASLSQCSKTLQALTKSHLYKGAAQSVLFAIKHPNESVSLAILSNYFQSNECFSLKTTYSIPEVSPRGRHGEIHRSYRSVRRCEMDILALSVALNRTNIFDFLLRHTPLFNTSSLEQNALDTASISSLCVALAYRKDQAAMAILEYGSPNPKGSHYATALHYAAAANLPLVIDHLVRLFQVDINHGDHTGDTPLIYAIASPNSDRLLIRQLITLGAITNKLSPCQGQYISPLSIACETNQWSIAMEILERGGDASGRTEIMLDFLSLHQPLRPLSRVCFAPIDYPAGTEGQRKAVINEILRRGADPNVSTMYNDRSEPLLSHLIRRKRDYEAICLLKCQKLDIEKTDSEDMTSLERALCTKHGRTNVAQLLLRRGAQISITTSQEITALMRRLWRATIPSQIYDLLQTHKTFAQCYQIVYKHFSSISPCDRDIHMEEFLNGCPAPMSRLIQSMGNNLLQDFNILNEMKNQFESDEYRPRHAAHHRSD